ncbi:Clan CA, family C2, calpain-like cysteine peptidase [Tritrichomonas foetus]|uniref:Clan CA, family C2, calpain-like cysteine peptidase n=1 Tax=Tritrichomonas foetus TaxID=1144522 RepID=A0A1J4J7T6_9EUKA|nr:Clan CA, family C2, calpain-like cysteine peptidase [Tritrichomonas foetus]|eukprot:OHS94729.1 Clan CA, family C2, calpain-like cysteine peptidase [Tritrichomonas foetus]
MDFSNFERQTFMTLGLSFGIPLLIILVAWFLILYFAFHFRPFILARVVISHTIKKPIESCLTGFVCVLWWIFFCLPFLGFIAFGVTTAILIDPIILGIIIAVAPTIILLVIYIFLDYSYRGFSMKIFPKILIVALFILLIGLVFAINYLLEPRSWMATAYCFAFPPLLFFGLAYAVSYRNIPTKVIKHAISDQEHLDQFINGLAEHNKKCFEGSNRLNIWWSFGIIIVSAIFNFLLIYDYWKKPERDATAGTAIGFFIVDFILLTAQAGSKIRPGFFFVILLGYAVKIVAVTFSSRFWITGHGCMYFVLSSFLLIRFAFGVWKPIKVNLVSNENHDVLIDKLNDLSQKKVKISVITIIMSAISWVLLTGGFVVELYFQYNNEFEDLPFPISQINAAIGMGTFSLPFSFLFIACGYLFFDHGLMTVKTLILYILSIAILVVGSIFWKGLENIFLLRLFLPTLVFFVFGCISLLIVISACKLKLCPVKGPAIWFIIFLILDIADVAIAIVLPFVLPNVEGNKLIGLYVILALLSILSFVSFTTAMVTLKNICRLPSLLTLIATIVFLVGFSACFGSVINGCIIFGTIFVVFCLILSLVYTKFNFWVFSLGPYLVAAIPSFIVLCLSIAALFLIDIDFFFAIIAFGFSFIFFGTSLFFWLQRKNFYFSFPSYASLIMLVIFSIAIIVFIAINIKSVFAVVSSILCVIFLVSFLGNLGFVLSQSSTNVIIVSNILLPIRRLVNGEIKTLNLFTFLFAISFCAPYFWGLFASIFFYDYYQFGVLGASFAIFIMSFLAFFLITRFNFHTFSAINFIQSNAIKYAITTAMSATSIQIEMAEREKPEKIDYEKYMNYIEHKVESQKSISLFFSSIKAQLYITSEVSFNSARQEVHNHYRKKGINADDIDFLEREKGWTGTEKMKIFELLAEIAASNPNVAKEDEYENFVNKQEVRRQQIIIPDTIDNKKFGELIRKTNGKFVDKEFGENHPEALTKGTTWKRMEEVYQSPMFNPNAPFNPNSIKQGQIGDCYFVSVLVALSRNPKLIGSIFSEPINNDKGAACVNFHFMGKTVPVIVDTLIPFGLSTPRFCKPVTKNDQWWCSIVEKAFAKHYGSYEAIDGGNSHVAFYRLTGGYPIAYFFTNLKVKEMIANGSFWNMMFNLHRSGSFMCAGSTSGSDTQQNSKGIVLGHAYSILRVEEVDGNKLIQMRNTWGNSEWKGEWSDKSSKWTPRMKRLLDFVDADDGVFWISFKDFTLNYQSFYAIAHYDKKSMFHYTLDGKWDPGSTDGASPTSRSKDALSLPQWIIRSPSKQRTVLKCFMEKSGAKTPSNAAFAYNDGEPVKLLYQGTKHYQQPMAAQTPITSWEWVYDEPAKPVTMLFYRTANAKPTHWHFEVYSDKKLEITPISH